MAPVRKLKIGAKKAPVKEIVPAKKVVAKPQVAAKAVTRHEHPTSYEGASGVLRQGRNLSPVVLDRQVGAFTDRDERTLRDLYEAHGKSAFERRNYDAGALSRLIGHGAIAHKAGQLDERTATFVITPQAIKSRLASA